MLLFKGNVASAAEREDFILNTAVALRNDTSSVEKYSCINVGVLL
jgi:hypothetical protein